MIFTKQMMWDCAVNTLGTIQKYSFPYNETIVIESPNDVEQLYKALQEAHWRAVDLYEKGVK